MKFPYFKLGVADSRVERGQRLARWRQEKSLQTWNCQETGTQDLATKNSGRQCKSRKLLATNEVERRGNSLDFLLKGQEEW